MTVTVITRPTPPWLCRKHLYVGVRYPAFWPAKLSNKKNTPLRPNRYEDASCVAGSGFLMMFKCFRVDFSYELRRVVFVDFTPALTVDSSDSTESRHPPVAVLTHS